MSKMYEIYRVLDQSKWPDYPNVKNVHWRFSEQIIQIVQIQILF
jgi:hypothetical protein